MDIEAHIDHHIDGRCEIRSADHLLARLAAAQHGVVARSQLDDAGFGRGAIDRRVSRGRLHPVHPGVYAVGHPKLTQKGRWMAAVLACGPGAVLSHRSAAALWNLRPTDRIDVTAERHRRGSRGIDVHRSPLPPDETTIVDGIPVTTVPRTLIDLAAVAPRDHVEKALNEAEVARYTDGLSLIDLVARHRGRRGIATIKAILEAHNRGLMVTDSELEDAFKAFVGRTGLPAPRLNQLVTVQGRTFKVDAVWPEHHLIVELDGARYHRTTRRFESDRERDRILQAAGWRVVRITWRQLHDRPHDVERDLRATMGLHWGVV